MPTTVPNTLGRSAVLAAVLTAATLAACDSKLWHLEPTADSVPLDSVIALTSDPAGPVTAETTTTVALTAHIPLDADVRIVTFTTTAGWFALTAHAQSLGVRAVLELPTDKRLTARAVLRTDTLKDSVTVDTATVGATVGPATSPFTTYLRIPMVRRTPASH